MIYKIHGVTFKCRGQLTFFERSVTSVNNTLHILRHCFPLFKQVWSRLQLLVIYIRVLLWRNGIHVGECEQYYHYKERTQDRSYYDCTLKHNARGLEDSNLRRWRPLEVAWQQPTGDKQISIILHQRQHDPRGGWSIHINTPQVQPQITS